MELNMNHSQKRRNSMKDIESKIIFGNFNKKFKNNSNDDDEEEPEFDITKIFKRNSPDENSYVVDNNIYFTDDINMDTMNKLIKQIRTLEKKLIMMGLNLKITPPQIVLHITSNGGSVIAALKCVNLIKSLSIEIHSVIDSYAASAATLISTVCTKRLMNKYSSVMIHELSSATSWARFSDLQDQVENMAKMMEQIKDIYVNHTNLKRGILSKLLKRDIDWTPEEALKNGLIDEIIE